MSLLILGPLMAAGAVPQPCCPCHTGAQQGLVLLGLFILAGSHGGLFAACHGLVLGSRLVGFVFLVWKERRGLAVGIRIFSI